MGRILFTATGSGCGKTTVTCGVLALLKRQGYHPAALKCGPDYIDPMYHRQVLGIPSGNLDTYFTDPATTRALLLRREAGSDITVLEGVMGYYDGIGGNTDQASTYEIARLTRTPAILVVNGRGASVSLAALVRGIMSYREDSGIRGLFLNQVSPSYYGRLKAMLEKECGIPVIGYLPVDAQLALPSRHLGLVTPDGIGDMKSWVERLADRMESTMDLGQLLHIASMAEPLTQEEAPTPSIPPEAARAAESGVRIAVASDEAFSFYYEENRELLEAAGAELVFFSPLRDHSLPEEADGLLLGGGYPECYARALSENTSMRSSIRAALKQGLPCIAECGGYLYLQRTLEGEDGRTYEMVGALDAAGYRKGRLKRFGYLETELLRPGLLGEAHERLRGHEFHHWETTEHGGDCLIHRPSGTSSYPDMIHTPTLAAGFPHYYYYSNPQVVHSFLDRCQYYRSERRARQHWDAIAKPIGSLGMLEDAIVKISGIGGDKAVSDYLRGRRALVILCADHGVVCEGVTQTDSQVTRIVAENFARGASSVNYMAARAGADVYTVDIGMDTPAYPERRLVTGAVIDRKVARGTRNLALEAAMTGEECRRALETGIQLAGELKEKGYVLIATGEMGIGNTTPSSVLAALLMHLSPGEVTGRGAGLSDEALQNKRAVVGRAVDRILREESERDAAKDAVKDTAKDALKDAEKDTAIDSEWDGDVFRLLAQGGGLEIAGMAGLFLGGVRYHIPIVIDGAISGISALIASRMDPRVKDYCLASHVSAEPTGDLALRAMGLKAPIQAGLCLGEGSGAVALLPLLDMAAAVYCGMGSFTDYEITPYVRYEDGT